MKRKFSVSLPLPQRGMKSNRKGNNCVYWDINNFPPLWYQMLSYSELTFEKCHSLFHQSWAAAPIWIRKTWRVFNWFQPVKKRGRVNIFCFLQSFLTMKQEQKLLGPLCISHRFRHTWGHSASSSWTTGQTIFLLSPHRNISPLSRLQPASVRRTVHQRGSN